MGKTLTGRTRGRIGMLLGMAAACNALAVGGAAGADWTWAFRQQFGTGAEERCALTGRSGGAGPSVLIEARPGPGPGDPEVLLHLGVGDAARGVRGMGRLTVDVGTEVVRNGRPDWSGESYELEYGIRRDGVLTASFGHGAGWTGWTAAFFRDFKAHALMVVTVDGSEDNAIEIRLSRTSRPGVEFQRCMAGLPSSDGRRP